jgi:hypothetical protein
VTFDVLQINQIYDTFLVKERQKTYRDKNIAYQEREKKRMQRKEKP